jgi:CheY-like chemotaxis protein
MIFTDFEMPEIAGPEFSKEIRRLESIKANEMKSTFIIGLTGHVS